MSKITAAAQHIQSKAGTEAPKLAIVLGSGLGELAGLVEDAVRIPFEDLDGFPVSGVSGHAGALVCGTLRGARVILLAGRAHYYEHGVADAMRMPIATLADLGCPVLALSNAAGSTRQGTPPGSLMAIRDHINWSGLNPLIGVQGDQRFVDMTNAYDPDLLARLHRVAAAQNRSLEEGIYAWFSGPSFETAAEIQAVRLLGADAVGMSTVPETILARYHGMQVAAVSAITNFAAGMPDAVLSHHETKAEADKLKSGFIALFAGFAKTFA